MTKRILLALALGVALSACQTTSHRSCPMKGDCKKMEKGKSCPAKRC